MIAEDDILRHLKPLIWLGVAVGIHIIISTQQLSRDVLLDSLIVNMPARIAFKMKGTKESEIVIGCKDACKLSGSGDLLFAYDEELKRLQSVYVELSDVETIVEHIASQPS